jgi:hypothetical protein
MRVRFSMLPHFTLACTTPKNVMNRLTGLFLVMALLFGQTALLEHEYDFAAHKSGDTCVTCLHATPLSHAMVGAVYLALPLPTLNIEFPFQSLQTASVTTSAYRARAPPPILSA